MKTFVVVKTDYSDPDGHPKISVLQAGDLETAISIYGISKYLESDSESYTVPGGMVVWDPDCYYQYYFQEVPDFGDIFHS